MNRSRTAVQSRSMRGVLPMADENRQGSAHAGIARKLCLVRSEDAAKVELVAGVLSPEVVTLRLSRRPSPWGRSCAGVQGSPSFCVENRIVAKPAADARAFADDARVLRNRFDLARFVTFYGVDFTCDITEGRPSCKDFKHISFRADSPKHLVFWHLALWWPVATRCLSRRSSGAGLGPSRRLSSAAASLPVPQSGPRATWYSARPIRTAADDLSQSALSDALPVIQDQVIRATGTLRAGGFVVVPEEIRRAA